MNKLIEQAKRNEVTVDVIQAAIEVNPNLEKLLDYYLLGDIGDRTVGEVMDERAAQVDTYDPILEYVAELECALRDISAETDIMHCDFCKNISDMCRVVKPVVPRLKGALDSFTADCKEQDDGQEILSSVINAKCPTGVRK